MSTAYFYQQPPPRPNSIELRAFRSKLRQLVQDYNVEPVRPALARSISMNTEVSLGYKEYTEPSEALSPDAVELYPQDVYLSV